VDAPGGAALEPSRWLIAEGRAQMALRAGFSFTAAAIYRDILKEEGLPAEARQTVTLALVTALLDAGDTVEAEKVLPTYTGPRSSTYQLRVGLLAAHARRLPQAKAALAAVKIESLAAADKGWWHFLQGQVADAEGNILAANEFYNQAINAAVSELARARFALGREQALLRRGPLDEARLVNLRKTMETFQGRATGFDAVRSYAAALAALGRAAEAQAVLQRQLAVIPPSERNTADQFRLMLGLIAGESSIAGRQAFKQLLRDGQKAETQRLALQLLARGSKSTVDREQLRRDLSDLINAPTPHTVIEDLLLVRSQLALADNDYARAEEDARALLERYPGSPLKVTALGVRLAVAWDLKRYRAAAEVMAQLRAVTKEGRERAELGVLLAEAFFRAEDYRNAADAYDAALHETPAIVPAGILLFQRVLSDIRADRLTEAAQQLDASATNPGFDAVNRWQAEWNLVKELQIRGQTPAAYSRVDRLLGEKVSGVPETLRVRLMWLRAKLAFDNNQLDAALQQTDGLLGRLQQAEPFDPALRRNVASMAQLLKAQIFLARNQNQEGFAVLEKLRADYRLTAAAQYSYIIQAGYLTQRGDMAAAQLVLVSFVDHPDYKRSEYAPLALYEAALNLERQGLDRHLRDAYEKMLERLIRDYPQDELVFYARLKQGDLLRRLNDMAAARQVYEYLVNNYPAHFDILLAEIALADCLFAQGANSFTNYESAAAIFERVRDLPSAPVDLRAEAGFKWGYALAKHAQSAKAQIIFWSVVDAFLLDAAQATQLGAKGRYWVSRSLLELAQLHEDAGQIDEAQRSYQLILDYKLYGLAQAQAKLARFRLPSDRRP
jgi:TolA-binding protein